MLIVNSIKNVKEVHRSGDDDDDDERNEMNSNGVENN